MANARSGDRRFARTYADQSERDHAALVSAVKSGVVAADRDR
jgi:hypothetical protein